MTLFSTYHSPRTVNRKAMVFTIGTVKLSSAGRAFDRDVSPCIQRQTEVLVLRPMRLLDWEYKLPEPEVGGVGRPSKEGQVGKKQDVEDKRQANNNTRMETHQPVQ